MKTTVNVSLNGGAYIIEEDAFAILKNYLDDIKSRLSESEGASEIISDVESRTAEILSSKITSSNQVVNSIMINNVISIIGAPHYFGESRKSEENHKTEPPRYQTIEIERKLMRDSDRRILGGVCAGIAAYFGSDISLIRILALVLFFCAGFGLIPYLILWIVIPKAVTVGEKEMLIRGYNK